MDAPAAPPPQAEADAPAAAVNDTAADAAAPAVSKSQLKKQAKLAK